MTRHGSAFKIRTLEEAAAWRAAAPSPVVFTNGVFDLVHPGHVAVLEAARSEGASLIVAINSDASARGLAKGPQRPVMTAQARAVVVAAFEAVNCVVLFDESTPSAVIAELQPDVLVKGGDYDPADVVGADTVKAHGGRVVIVPLVPNQSTTRIVERLRASS